MKFFKKYSYQIILLIVVFLIFLTNYQKSTFLIGWDNFNSELNPALAVKQALNAGWSDFRSFGLVAGMGYATDLWHAIFIWISSIVLPLNTVRYVFHCLMFLIGALGTYSFFKYIKLTPFISFIGSLSYILNFGTIQIFGLPYEPFSVFFAFFPWALLTWFKLIKKLNRQNLLHFFITNLLLSGAFYVQTMFIVYCLALFIINLILIVKNRSNSLTFLKKSALIWLLLIITNSYWLFSQIYFLINNVEVVRQAKQTLLGWGIPFFQNKSHSNLFDFFIQKAFYTDFTNSQGLSLFQPWLDYQQQPIILLSSIIYIFFIIVGIVDAKHKYKKYFFGLLLLIVVSLLTTLPLLGLINKLIRLMPMMDQVFRAPFSKFATLQSFIFSFFLCVGIQSIYKKINKPIYKKFLLAIPVLLIFTTSFPVFKNRFFTSEVKKSIPQEYFQLSNFFHKQAPNSRIALFPETNIWGWYNYNWGYTGSGFLWHFIQQPIISRSYDVWNQNSENYFWEISHAINSRNDKDILNTLKKYQVSYLLIDYSLSGDSNKSRIKQIDFLNKFISNNLSPNSLVFKSPNLSVHKLNGSSQFSITTSLTNTGPDTNRLYQDNIFSTHTNYQNNSRKQYDYYYPFIDLQTQSYNPKQLWQISEENNNFIITTTLPNTLLRYSFLTQPDTNDQLPINIKTNNNQLIISFPKIPINFENYTSTYDCSSSNSYQKKGSNLNISSNQNMLSISVTNKAKACWSYHYDSISGIDSYLLSINPAQILGPPPIMNIESHTTKNLLSKQQINKTGKNYYIIPQTSSQDRGISAHFEIQSYLQSNSHFTTAIPQLYLFPEQFLKQIYFTKHSPTTSSQTIPTISKKINPWLHKLSITNQQHILIFNQSFDSDWIAFYFNGIKPVFLKNHILINNWANGWEIVRNADLHSLQIYIFFWPQLLQFLGFALLILAFIYIFRKS